MEQNQKYDPFSKRGGLFSPYINTFLKIKQEASGPPDWIKSDADSVKYVEEYFEKEGISLDKCSIKKNPGLRALSKLCLNSFWGKFGQRLNMRQTDYFHESEEDSFFKVFCDPMKQRRTFTLSRTI